jgi:hypothetical protein
MARREAALQMGVAENKAAASSSRRRLTIAATNARFQLADFTGRVGTCGLDFAAHRTGRDSVPNDSSPQWALQLRRAAQYSASQSKRTCQN